MNLYDAWAEKMAPEEFDARCDERREDPDVQPLGFGEIALYALIAFVIVAVLVVLIQNGVPA